MDRHDPSRCYPEYTDGLVHAVLGHKDTSSSQKIAHDRSSVIYWPKRKPQRIKDESQFHQ